MPLLKHIVYAINIVGDSTFEKIDDGEHKHIKKQIKLPMILLSLVAGMIGGL